MKKRILPISAAILLLCVSFSWAGPETVRKVDQLKQSAIDFMNQGKYMKAVPLLKEALSINPSDKTAARYLNLSKQLIAESVCKQAAEAYFDNNYPKAIERWEEVLRINPDDRRITGLIDATKNLIQDNTTESMYGLVDRFFKEGKYDMALNEIEKILNINPDEKRAKDLLKTISRAIVDKEVKTHYDKADAYLKQKRFDLAIDEWKEVLKIDPEQEGAAVLIASTVRKTFLDSTYGKAEQLFAEGDYMSALDQYNRILLDNPTDQYVKKIISRLNSTIRISPKILKQGTEWDMVRKSLANYISMDGNQKVALAAVWYAVQLSPDNNLANSIRDFLEHELIAIVRTMEYPVKDMTLIDQYLFAALNNIYGGRYDLAVQECSIVLELQPNNLLALKRLGSAYYALKQPDKAREVWQRALKIAPDDAELKKYLSEMKSGVAIDTPKKKKK